jgi:hypothetical protein
MKASGKSAMQRFSTSGRMIATLAEFVGPGHLRLYTKGSFGAFHRGQKAERWSQEQFAAGRLAARKLQRDGKKDRMAAD